VYGGGACDACCAYVLCELLHIQVHVVTHEWLAWCRVVLRGAAWACVVLRGAAWCCVVLRGAACTVCAQSPA